MNTNKSNQDQGKKDKNVKQNQSQTPAHGKGREDGQAKGPDGKSSPDKKQSEHPKR